MSQKILLVDFDANLLHYFKTILNKRGLEVVTLLAERSKGYEERIVEQILSLKPDLVIIEPYALNDQEEGHGEQHGRLLPIGLEAVELLRRYSNLPVMYLGMSYRGHTEEDPDGKELFERILATHPVSLVTKPFMEPALLVGVDLALASREDRLLTLDADSTNPVTATTKQLLRASRELQTQVQYLAYSQKEADLSSGKLRAVFDCVTDPIFLKDEHMRYSMINPAMAQLIDRAPSEIIGKVDRDLFEATIAERFQEVDSRVMEGESIEQEYSRTIGGATFTFLDSRFPIKGISGEVIGICGVSRDITERRGLSLEREVTDGEYPSLAMQACLKRARVAAGTDSIVLLLGETGSGKDHLSKYIHKESKRANGPFFAINCAALPPELAESEWFGHEPGAFTGAQTRKRGLLELAEGGTLLLNEIGELSLPMQSKLLTFLDTKKFTRVGGEKTVTVNARLIAATHRNLQTEVEEGRFLEPLFYRLNVMPIRVPPLRERVEDIPIIVSDLLVKLAQEMLLPTVPKIEREVMNALQSYHWPGNVRELRNVLERALILGGEMKIALKDALPNIFTEAAKPKDDGPTQDAVGNWWKLPVTFREDSSDGDLLKEALRSLIDEALRRSNGNKTQAARLLGITLPMLKSKIQTLGITRSK